MDLFFYAQCRILELIDSDVATYQVGMDLFFCAQYRILELADREVATYQVGRDLFFYPQYCIRGYKIRMIIIATYQ
jgi:hypothetical protein